MTENAMVRIGVFLALLIALAVPLGGYLARVYVGDGGPMRRLAGGVERRWYRWCGIRADLSMSWQTYATAVLLFNLAGVLVVYALARLQAVLPGTGVEVEAMPPALAFNTAVSFATNTNWQAYAGESLAYLTQVLGLTVQNFASAATGMAVLIALIRGFGRRPAEGIGNFWVDVTRGVLYVLLPLSIVLALLLVSQGVVQTFGGPVTAQLLDPTVSAAGSVVGEQVIAVGPAAAQIAIKQLGTNGGGFFNANSAHPFENPTAWSGLLELLAILLIPAALCVTFGALVGDRRQGVAVLVAMLAIFIPAALITVAAEQTGTPVLAASGAELQPGDGSAGGNMEGKEVRFGIVDSALWATATTAASNGSVNSMHDSFTPLGGLLPLFLMQIGEVVFGGVGSGLYGMLIYAILAVFIAGLMVGRTPEYLGKKIEAFEMKMVALVLLIPAAAVLLCTALACLAPAGTAALGNPGPHGFSEMLYAFSSGANNNGSAFAGLAAGTPFYAIAIGLCMLIGRYFVIVPVLALAGSLARKQCIPVSAGTLPTHTPLFVLLLVGAIVLFGALTFVPALALGPIVEQLILRQH